MPTWREATINLNLCRASWTDHLVGPRPLTLPTPAWKRRSFTPHDLWNTGAILIKVKVLRLNLLPKTNNVKWLATKMECFSRGTTLQNYTLLIRSFHLKCLSSTHFSFFRQAIGIIPSHPQSWNKFRFEASTPSKNSYSEIRWSEPHEVL